MFLFTFKGEISKIVKLGLAAAKLSFDHWRENLLIQLLLILKELRLFLKKKHWCYSYSERFAAFFFPY